MDHNVQTGDDTPVGPLTQQQLATLPRNCEEFGVPLHGTGSGRKRDRPRDRPGGRADAAGSHDRSRRLAHVDPRRLRHGTSAVEDVLATQTLPQRKQRSLRIRFVGEPATGVGANDFPLAAIGWIGVYGGVDGAVGHVIEYAGPASEALAMEGG